MTELPTEATAQVPTAALRDGPLVQETVVSFTNFARPIRLALAGGCYRFERGTCTVVFVLASPRCGTERKPHTLSRIGALVSLQPQAGNACVPTKETHLMCGAAMHAGATMDHAYTVEEEAFAAVVAVAA